MGREAISLSDIKTSTDEEVEVEDEVITENLEEGDDPKTSDGDEPKTPEPEQEPEPAKVDPKGNAQDTPDDSWLEEFTGGQIKTRDGIKTAFEELNQLRAQSKIKPEITFEKPADKMLYDFAKKWGNGNDWAGAQRFISTMNIDLSKATEKDLLFEKFMIDNPELSREEGRGIFDGMIDEKYPQEELESKAHKKFQFSSEAKAAKAEIEALQKQFQEGLVQPPDAAEKADTEAKKVAKTIDETLPKYKGYEVSINFGEDDKVTIGPKTDDKKTNFSFSVANVDELKQIAHDPTKLWESLFKNEKGEFDYGKYIETLHFIKNKDQILTELAGHSYDRGKRSQIEKQKGIKKDTKEETSKSQGSGSELLDSIRKAKVAQGLE